MNSQLEYLAVKTHIEELVRAAERGRMAHAAGSPPRTAARVGLVSRLRGVSRRHRALTASDACAECP
jgi:hypothetical protein